ncbi:MAG: GNAT family N-acetyltransferase [Vicinamibacterales bacterium]
MSLDQMLEPGVVIRHSPVETDRFGHTIDRVTIGPGPVDADRLSAVIQGLSASVLIVRYDAARLEVPGILARSPRALLPAGALTYWEKAVAVVEPVEESNIQVLPANTLDPETVCGLVRRIVEASFQDYGNHYMANPLLDRSAALAGYVDWAVRTVKRDPANVLVMTDRGELIGLATLEAGADGRHVEILLAGLVPTAQGKGMYGSLLDECERVAAAHGARRMVISTQVHNVRVQRAWARHGLRPFAAIETVHLIDRDLLLASHGKEDSWSAR